MSDLFEELLNSLSELPLNKDYSSKDRYDDFRQVFMGTEQGKRVYRELLSWGKLFSPSMHGSPIDPYHMAVVEGHRNFATKLMAAVNIDPPIKETKARSRK
jgi:hypothetical protein